VWVGRGAGSVQSAVVGAGTRHLPPSRTHAPATNPRRTHMYVTLFSGEVAGVRGAIVRSRNVNWREWLIGASRGCRRPTQCLPYAARDVSVIGSRLKSTISAKMGHQIKWDNQAYVDIATLLRRSLCPSP